MLDFLSVQEPFDISDVYPWRLSRGLSYIRHPLIILEKEDGIYIGWGLRHLFESFEYIVRTSLNGRMQARYQSKKMQQWIGNQNKSSGELFTREIANKLSEYPRFIVDMNVIKIGSIRIGFPGPILGDVDVLLIVPRKKKIILIECKDFAIARTPIEMKREIEGLVFGTEDKPSTVTKHQRRMNWITENINLVFDVFDLSPKGRWEVSSIIVVSNELISPYYHSSPMPIMSKLTFIEDFIPTLL
jgi:hypothetical protein